MTLESTRSSLRRPDRRGNWFWSRAHFLVRLLGLTGFLVGCISLVLLREVANFFSAPAAAFQTLVDTVRGAPPADLTAKVGVYGLLASCAALLLVLFVELVMVLGFVAARRSVMGFNAVFQIALAAVLLVGVNVFAFVHPLRQDCTRAGQFTLPPAIERDLQKLKGDDNGKMTIVVYQRHKTIGALNDKPDRYDYAAERKVVEMVKDLVAQFREAGPQFEVVELDVEAEGYDQKLKQLTEAGKKPKPELRKAIDAAPEDCIFFYQNGKLQQLSFNEFVQLDKTASKAGRGNLVLLAQGAGASGRGVETFARRIFNIDERKPRIGVLVIHEELTTQGSDDAISMQGLRKLLESRGFEVRDVVLKKGWRTGNLEAAADTQEEGRLESLEAEIERLDGELKELQDEIKDAKALVADWSLKPNEDEDAKLDYLSRKYVLPDGRRIRVTSELRKRQLDVFQKAAAQVEEMVEERKSDLEESQKERTHLDLESIAENKRMTDMHGKLQRVLADCDLLFIPRLTRGNGFFISPHYHNLDAQQVSALKAFLAAGKPIFACLGPVSTPRPGPVPGETEDHFESMLADLGIRLNKQTILFNADARAFAQRRSSFSASGGEKVPLLDFDNATAVVRGRWLPSEAAQKELPNPLRESLKVTARSVGSDFDLRVRFPRPVYYDPAPQWFAPAEAAGRLGSLALPQGLGPLTGTATPVRQLRPEEGPQRQTDPTFLITGVGWNDDRPFPAEDEPAPRYRPPKPDDPLNKTPDEKRRAQFPIGVAVEAPIPTAWTNGAPVKARIAVIGQADLFAGKELKPANERLFLETANWLLGREDYLPTAQHELRYPRIELTPQNVLWMLACSIGLPALFGFLGIVVLLIRGLR